MNDTSTEAVKQLVAKRRSDPWALHLGKQVDNTMLALAAENARLREALHRISLGAQNSMTQKEELGREARVALAGDAP